ncbi:MAG TPA: hypothetical protein VMW53_00535 [archaeon]|nr:hypothetical protein [archaeon]
MTRALLVLVLVYMGSFEQASAQVLLPPLHLTVILHNEEPDGRRPDYTADRNFYLQNRQLVKLLAETITSKSATFNFQSDWNYLKAVAMFDTGSVTSNTAGKNIIRWMHENLGIEIDPHAHETQYNYADVAYLIEQLGVAPSKNIGGFLYYPADNPQGWEKHINGMQGKVYPAYFWKADNLWGAATYLHRGTDDQSSGIWRPKDRFNFYQHDSTQRLIYIGGGGKSYKDVRNLLNDISAGRAPTNGFYTAKLPMIQDLMTDSSIQKLGRFIDSLSLLVEQRRVRWKTLAQMSQLWKTEYNGKPFRYVSSFTPALYQTQRKEVWVRNVGTQSNNGNLIFARIHQPIDSLYPGQRFPAAIYIPGGISAGAMMQGAEARMLDLLLPEQGFVLVSFNAEGRVSPNPLDKRSEGVEDYNGKIHQDDLKAIADYVLSLPNVKADNVGIYTFSFGITMGAGCVGRYPTLQIKYLVDREGPSDSKVTCFDYGRRKAETYQGLNKHYSTVKDSSATNIAWWNEREAVQWIGKFRGRYLRIQSEVDHAQPPWFHGHTIDMINAATHTKYGGRGQSCWTRVNGSQNAVNKVYDQNIQPVWLREQPGTEDMRRKALDYVVEMANMPPLTSVELEGQTSFYPKSFGCFRTTLTHLTK